MLARSARRVVSVLCSVRVLSAILEKYLSTTTYSHTHVTSNILLPWWLRTARQPKHSSDGASREIAVNLLPAPSSVPASLRTCRIVGRMTRVLAGRHGSCATVLRAFRL